MGRRLRSGAVVAAMTSSWVVAVPLATPAAQAAVGIVVNTTAAGVNESDGKCSLAEAIASANFNLNVAIKTAAPDVWVTTECASGQLGADTITLQPGTYSFSAVYDDLYNPM